MNQQRSNQNYKQQFEQTLEENYQQKTMKSIQPKSENENQPKLASHLNNFLHNHITNPNRNHQKRPEAAEKEPGSPNQKIQFVIPAVQNQTNARNSINKNGFNYYYKNLNNQNGNNKPLHQKSTVIQPLKTVLDPLDHN